MLLTLKGSDGSPAIIETANICFIGQAADAQTKQVLLGYCTIMFPGGVGCMVKGSPSEVKEIIDKAAGDRL